MNLTGSVVIFIECDYCDYERIVYLKDYDGADIDTLQELYSVTEVETHARHSEALHYLAARHPSSTMEIRFRVKRPPVFADAEDILDGQSA